MSVRLSAAQKLAPMLQGQFARQELSCSCHLPASQSALGRSGVQGGAQAGGSFKFRVGTLWVHRGLAAAASPPCSAGAAVPLEAIG